MWPDPTWGRFETADHEVDPGELDGADAGPLYDTAGLAQARAVWGAAAGDLRGDAALADEATVLVVVIAAVGEDSPGLVTGASAPVAEAGNRVQQGDELGDVVPVLASQRCPRAGCRASQRSHRACCRAAAVHVEEAGLTGPDQQYLVERGPQSGLAQSGISGVIRSRRTTRSSVSTRPVSGGYHSPTGSWAATWLHRIFRRHSSPRTRTRDDHHSDSRAQDHRCRRSRPA